MLRRLLSVLAASQVFLREDSKHTVKEHSIRENVRNVDPGPSLVNIPCGRVHDFTPNPRHSSNILFIVELRMAGRPCADGTLLLRLWEVRH